MFPSCVKDEGLSLQGLTLYTAMVSAIQSHAGNVVSIPATFFRVIQSQPGLSSAVDMDSGTTTTKSPLAKDKGVGWGALRISLVTGHRAFRGRVRGGDHLCPDPAADPGDWKSQGRQGSGWQQE